jgi:hypothetical protein
MSRSAKKVLEHGSFKRFNPFWNEQTFGDGKWEMWLVCYMYLEVEVSIKKDTMYLSFLKHEFDCTLNVFILFFIPMQ